MIEFAYGRLLNIPNTTDLTYPDIMNKNLKIERRFFNWADFRQKLMTTNLA